MKQRILFLCTGNSARSQMAEGLLRLFAGNRFEAASAGTHPIGLHPMTVNAMEEIGIDMRDRRSKRVDEFAGQSFTYVITVCDRAKDACPVFPNANLRHWSFEDPATAPVERQPEVFRRIRNEITNRLRQFLIEEIGLAPATLQARYLESAAFPEK